MKDSLGSYTHRLSGGWKMEIIQTLEEIQSIRPIWRTLQEAESFSVINSDIDRYLSILNASEDHSSPLILLFRENDQPRAMIVGRLENHAVPIQIGYRTVWNPKLRCFTVIYGGILGRLEKGISTLIIREILKVIQQTHIELVYFNHLKHDSDFIHVIRTIPSFLLRSHFSKSESHWRMRIPKTMEEFYASCSRKHRQHLRQYQRKLEATFPNQVSIQMYRKSDEVSKAIQDASKISQNTYQGGLGAGITDTVQKRAILTEAAKNGWFRGSILYLGDEPAAYRFGLQYGNVFYGDGIGYDPKWGQYRIGTYLFLKVLENLIQEQRVEYYDFGYGDAEYKESYGDQSWQEAVATYLFARRLYPLFVNVITTISTANTLLLSKVLKKANCLNRIKRLWRNKIQSMSRKE